jgi:hypothetical protein
LGGDGHTLDCKTSIGGGLDHIRRRLGSSIL